MTGIEKRDVEVPVKNEQSEEDKILDSFLNQVDEQRKDWMNNVFANNEKLKKWFKDFLKYAKETDIIDAVDELSNCESQEDVQKFIEDHQWYKIPSSGITDNMKIKKNTTEVAEWTAAQEVATAVAVEDNEKQNKEISKNLQETAEKIRTNKIAEEEHKRLLSRYPELGEKTDKNSDLYKNVEGELKNKGVIKQLEEVGKDINDSNFVEKYISYQATLQELSINRANYDKNDISLFERAVKNLNNACNIPDTRLSSFSKENIWQTRTDLFTEGIWNQSLIEARNNNKDNRDYSEVFHEISEEELIKNYWNLFMNSSDISWDSKLFFTQYLTNPNTRNEINNMKNTPWADDLYKDNPLFNNYKNMILDLESIKNDVEDKTKDMIEEMCLITQVNSMAKCIWQEGFGLNKANDIKYDETWAMVLDGHIDGVDFSVRHNFNEARAPLQTSSKLIESADGNTLEFWVNWKQKFKDSPFKLPSQESIFGMVSDFVASTNFSGERFNSVEDYIDNMQEWIVWKMDDVFDKDAEVANDYMQNEIKWEKIVDGSLLLIKHIKPSIDFTKVINRNDGTERKMFDFMKILNYNIENSTPEEKNKLDWSINEIERITDNYKSNEKSSELYSESISKYLENDKWLDTSPEKEWIDTKQNETSTVDENENLEKQDQRLWLIFDMFIDFNKNPTDKSREGNEWNYGTPLHMIVNDLYRELHDKPKEKEEQIKRDEISKAEQVKADNMLNQLPPETRDIV